LTKYINEQTGALDLNSNALRKVNIELVEKERSAIRVQQQLIKNQIATESLSQAEIDMMKAQGMSDKDIQNRIKNNATLNDLKVQQALLDKEYTEVLKKLTALQHPELEAAKATNAKNNNTVQKENIHLTSEQLKANEDLEKSIKSYQAKLEDLGATDLMIIENERNRALASVAASGATAAEQDKANRKLNEYYDALVKTTQAHEKYAGVAVGAEVDTTEAIKQANEELEKQKKELEKVTESVEKGLTGALQGVASLFSAVYDQRMEDLDNEMYAEEKAAGVLQDTAVQTAEKNLAKAKEGNNAEIIADAEKALKRAQIEEAYEKKKAQSAYEAAKIQWGLQLALATAQGVVSVMNAFSTFPFIPVGLAAGIAQTIESGIQIASIYAAEPKAPSFHSGGVYDAAPEGTAILKRGEMTLTTEQQAGLWNFIKSGSSGGRGDININNQFGDVNSDVDIERYNKTLAKQIQAVMHT
jgi:hypothetical protein